MKRSDLKKLIKEIIQDEVVVSTPSDNKYVLMRVTDDYQIFQKEIQTSEDIAKNKLVLKLKKKFLNKMVGVIAAKGQEYQPKKEYQFMVKDISVMWVVKREEDKYDIIFKDENKKEYFIDSASQIKVFNQPGEESQPLPVSSARSMPPPSSPKPSGNATSNIVSQTSSSPTM